MKVIQQIKKPVSQFMICALLGLSLHLPMANAALIGTEQALTQQGASDARTQALAVLQRADVTAKLIEYGVTPAEAEQRIAHLTDAEAVQLAQQLDQLPAGGDILGVAVFVFLVLLFTDIMGFTDVFPFVKKTVR